MKKLLFLLIGVYCYGQQSKTDSINLYYETNKAVLTLGHKEQLSSFLDKRGKDSIILITVNGYADYRGSSDYNAKLSKKRAQRVNTYLSKSYSEAIELNALGELPNITNYKSEAGIPEHRKVTILCTYNVPPSISKSKPNPKYDYLYEVDKLKSGDKMRLKNINFLFGTARLTKASIPELNNLTEVLKKNTALKILIEGHVCCGSDKEVKTKKASFENDYLSSKRAKKIYDYLVDKGIDPERLSHQGYGFTQPLRFPEKNDDDTYQNRRIEVKVLENN